MARSDPTGRKELRDAQLQTLTITLTDAPGALQRVITVCTRRRLEVVTLAFDRASEDGFPRVEVCVQSSPRQLAGARAWLGGLIDVVAVQEAGIHDVHACVEPSSP